MKIHQVQVSNDNKLSNQDAIEATYSHLMNKNNGAIFNFFRKTNSKKN